MKPDNDNYEPTPVIGKPGPAGYHVIVDETRDGRTVAVRAPLPAARPERMVEAERGFWEDWNNSRADTQAIIDEMTRRTMRELASRPLVLPRRRRAA